MEIQNKTDENIHLGPELGQEPKTLPLAYVMWLTMRSKFLDHISHKQEHFYEQWKEFEHNYLKELERES